MFWGRNKKPLRRIAAAVFLSTFATAAAADVLVVRATGPSAKAYRAGMKLPDNAKINLKANDTLVLIDGRGTRTLRGPGEFTPSAAPQAATRSAALVSGAGARRPRIGAVRGVEGPDNYWLVNVEKSSPVCIADPETVTLWRSDAARSKTMIVTRTSDGTAREVEWAPNQSTIAWPADFRINEGDSYRLAWKGDAPPAEIKFRTLPAEPSGIEDMAAAFIEKGCEAQLDVLVGTVQLPEKPAA